MCFLPIWKLYCESKILLPEICNNVAILRSTLGLIWNLQIGACEIRFILWFV